MKYVCGIVTYFPNESIIGKIKEYSNVFEHILVFDNTPNGSKFLKKLDNFLKVEVIFNKQNLGLSKAYEILLEKAEDGYNYLCLLDQDSVFNSGEIHKMMNFINIYPSKENVAIFSPRIVYNERNLKTFVSDYEFKKFVISSGSFINLEIVKNDLDIKFDANYFIDRVDTDFCMLCVKKGYKLVQYNKSVLIQQLGTEGHFGISQHSYKRHYYIFRNRFYYNQKFYRHYKSLSILQTLKQCLRIILFEDEKTLKLKQLSYAIHDFNHGCMSKGRY